MALNHFQRFDTGRPLVRVVSELPLDVLSFNVGQHRCIARRAGLASGARPSPDVLLPCRAFLTLLARLAPFVHRSTSDSTKSTLPSTASRSESNSPRDMNGTIW